jgi:rod shape-determining protein MreB
LIIGAPTAERLKIELGSAIEPTDPSLSRQIKGRDVQEGTPKAIDITSEEVCVAAESVVNRLARVVQRALGELQPEVAADIYERGLILTGGGALFEGLSELLSRETKLNTRVADEPRHACVRGLQQLIDEPLLLRRVARNEHSLLLEATDAGAFEG